jgi:putative phosphoesterase
MAGPQLLVGLVSDTHRLLPEAASALLAGVGLILHAGDIGSPELLDELGSIAPVLAVLGNNDLPADYPGLPYERRETLAGVDVYLTHDPHGVSLHLRGSSGRDGAQALPGLCVHGHTHRPRDEYQHGVRVVNPGSTSRPRGGSRRSLALLTLSQGHVEKVEFRDLRVSGDV